MPQFYFNSQKGDQVIADLEGELLADIEAAKQQAMASARELLAMSILSGAVPPDFVEVIDKDGHAVFKIALKDLIPNSLKG